MYSLTMFLIVMFLFDNSGFRLRFVLDLFVVQIKYCFILAFLLELSVGALVSRLIQVIHCGLAGCALRSLATIQFCSVPKEEKKWSPE